jgi:hypothetical protein
MNSPAAFTASYSDWKLIRTRKVVQIVLEVPVEAAGQAYDVLGGMPNSGAEIWCAIARLQGRKESEAHQRATDDSRSTPARHDRSPASVSPGPMRAKFSDKLYAQQAGILCNDPKFIRFLCERFDYTKIEAGEPAAVVIRDYCDVQSRSEIRPGTDAGTRWELLLSAYRVWDLAPACGAA